MTLHRSDRYRLSVAVTVLTMGCLAGAAGQPALKPNLVFILTDDQGHGDMSCHGNPVLQTPNIDRIHNEGVRFTDFHVSPTCAPTRSALMTGRHEFRNGVTHTIQERERLTLQPADVNALTAHIDFFPTLAELAGARSNRP